MRERARFRTPVRYITILGLVAALFLEAAPARPPVRAQQARAYEPCGPHVYFDVYHNADVSAFNELNSLITGDLGGVFTVQARFIDAAALDGYNVLLIEDPEYAFDPAEIAAIDNFVQGGGRLVVLGEWYGAMDWQAVNDLLAGVGVPISFNKDTVYDDTNNEGWSQWPRVDHLANHPLTDGVSQVAFYAGASLNVGAPAVALASGDEDTYTALSAVSGLLDDEALEAAGLAPQEIYPGSPIVMAYSWAGPGSVFVVGDSGLWADYDTDLDGTNNLGEFNHRQLARNVFDYPWCRRFGCHRILFDETHGWAYASDTGDLTIEEGFAELAAFLRGQGHLVESLRDPALLDAPTLDRYDTLVLLLPQEYYSADEKAAIAGFVNAGGRLVTISEWGGWAGVSLDILNDVHAALGDGLHHQADLVEDPTDNEAGYPAWPILHVFADHPVNAGVDQVVQLGGSSLHLSGPAFGTAFGDEDTSVFTARLGGDGAGGEALPEGWAPKDPLPGPERDAPSQADPVVFHGMARLGAGDVFAIGDASLWLATDPVGDGRMLLYRRDNAKLAHNVFARGEWCPRCPVALFREEAPWSPDPGRDPADSLSAPAVPPPVDDTLLDVMGNLPQDSMVAPLAPQSVGDVINDFAAPDSGVSGLEWIDGFLWASSTSDSLYRLAPADGTVLETIALPSGIFACGMAWDGSSFWIADCYADEIVQVSPSGTELSSFPSPSTGPVGLAWDGSHLWDVDFVDDQLHRIDPATGTVVDTIPAPDTRAKGLAWDGAYLWTNGRDTPTTYQIYPSTGSVRTSFATPPGATVSNGQGATFDGQYLWTSNTDLEWIYQVDVEYTVYFADPNEQILQAWNIPYDLFGAADMGSVDLSPYCKVIVPSTQPYSFYQALAGHRSWFEDWITEGGTFDLHGASYISDDWSGLMMPGGFTSAFDPEDDLTLVEPDHVLVNEPNTVAGADIDYWNHSTHGYLAYLPSNAQTVITAEALGQPVLAEFRLGRGCVVATEQTLEYGWRHGYSRLLENIVLYRCQPLTRIYVPLVLRAGP